MIFNIKIFIKSIVLMSLIYNFLNIPAFSLENPFQSLDKNLRIQMKTQAWGGFEFTKPDSSYPKIDIQSFVSLDIKRSLKKVTLGGLIKSKFDPKNQETLQNLYLDEYYIYIKFLLGKITFGQSHTALYSNLLETPNVGYKTNELYRISPPKDDFLFIPSAYSQKTQGTLGFQSTQWNALSFSASYTPYHKDSHFYKNSSPLNELSLQTRYDNTFSSSLNFSKVFDFYETGKNSYYDIPNTFSINLQLSSENKKNSRNQQKYNSIHVSSVFGYNIFEIGGLIGKGKLNIPFKSDFQDTLISFYEIGSSINLDPFKLSVSFFQIINNIEKENYKNKTDFYNLSGSYKIKNIELLNTFFYTRYKIYENFQMETSEKNSFGYIFGIKAHF